MEFKNNMIDYYIELTHDKSDYNMAYNNVLTIRRWLKRESHDKSANSVLRYYVSIMRNKPNCVKSLHNVINTMKISRNSYICNEDFSDLNFGNIPLNDIYFSDEGNYPSQFNGSTINILNLMSENLGEITNVDVAYSYDSNNIITSSDDGIICWNIETGSIEYKIENSRLLAFYPDKKRILIACDSKKVLSPLSVWDLETKKEIYNFNFKEFILFYYQAIFGKSDVIKFSTDGKMILIGSNLFDVKTKKKIYKLKGHKDDILAAAFSPDSNRCLTVSYDGTAILWKLDGKKKILYQFTEHLDPVTCVAFSPVAPLCLTGSEDKTIILWNTLTGKPIHKFEQHTDSINAISFSPDGKFFLSGSADNTVILWNIENKKKYTHSQHTLAKLLLLYFLKMEKLF